MKMVEEVMLVGRACRNGGWGLIRGASFFLDHANSSEILGTFLVKMVLIVFMIPVIMAHIYSALIIIRIGGVPCMNACCFNL